MGELSSHEEIAETFQELRSQLSQIASRLHDLGSEKMEHEAVIKALGGLDSDRRCYRLVGEILVEHTVKEVLPAVKRNKEQIEMVEGKLKEQLGTKKAELSDFQEKYKIRIRSAADVAEEEKKAEAAKPHGVLV